MQLKFSENQNKALQIAVDILAALALGAAFVALWIRSLGFSWSPGTAFRGGVLSGFLSCWDQLAVELGRSLYLILPRFGGGMDEGGELLPQGLFLTLMGVLLSVLAFLMIRSRLRVWLVFPVLTWILLLFCTEMDPGFLVFLAFTAALAMAWVQMGRDHFRRGTALAAVVLVLALSVAAGVLLDKKLSFDPLQITDRTGAAIERVLHARYGSGALASGKLNILSGKDMVKERGTIRKRAQALYGSKKDKTKVALEVKGKNLESYYLRGYVGERYKGDRWERLDNSVYYDNLDNQYWLNKSGFDGLSQLDHVSQLVSGGSGHKALSIKVKHADKSQLYIPYEMAGTEKRLPKGSVSYAGGALGTTKLFGSRKYDLRCGSNITGTWTDWVGQLYSSESQYEVMDYFTSESHYNVWCYQKDTEVPEKIWQELYTALGDPGDQYGNHTDYKEAIQNVTEFMEMNFQYSDRFKPLSKKKDFLIEFMKSRKGCDVHYASLATMMFRFYRIPARYVEGYLMTPTDVENGKVAKLKQSHAHAWTEIYVDGYGWVPIEVTPEYQGVMAEPNMEVGLESISYDSMPEITPPPTPDEDTDTEQSSGQGNRLKKAAVYLALGLLAILLLVLLFLFGRKGRQVWKRKKDFTHPDPGHGVRAMYGYMLEKGMPISAEAASIGNAAAFSQLTIEEKHRGKMRDEMVLSKAQWKRDRKQSRKEKRKQFLQNLRKPGLGGLKKGFGRKSEGSKHLRPKRRKEGKEAQA